jgi:hypothetical protein
MNMHPSIDILTALIRFCDMEGRVSRYYLSLASQDPC